MKHSANSSMRLAQLPLDSADDARRQSERPSAAGGLMRRTSGILNRALLGLVLMILLAVGVTGWSAVAELAGAVIAPGQIVVEQSSKSIQHPTGGIVTEIRVANGQRVAAGEVLLRLDDTQARASLEVIAGKLQNLRGERARLAAERDRTDLPAFADAEGARQARQQAIAAGERGLFEARRNLTENQKQRLRQRIEQVRRELQAIEAQRKAKAQEIELIRKELGMVEALNRRQLTNISRVIDMQRQLARFEGEHASLNAQGARVAGQVYEIELLIFEIEQRNLVDAHKELRDAEARIEELEEREKAVRDQVARTELRAPIAGVIHELAVHTIGGVIRTGEIVMQVVPDDDALTIEARVAPTDIDQVAMRRRAILRLTALDQRTTPELLGSVVHVGADLTRDTASSRSHYAVRVRIDEEQTVRLGSSRLLPGMPVEVFIETGKRTALSYLLKPVRDNLARSMREP